MGHMPMSEPITEAGVWGWNSLIGSGSATAPPLKRVDGRGLQLHQNPARRERNWFPARKLDSVPGE